jgi:hypothetical protein
MSGGIDTWRDDLQLQAEWGTHADEWRPFSDSTTSFLSPSAASN